MLASLKKKTKTIRSVKSAWIVVVPLTSNWYQNFAIFMQLIACLAKEIAILCGTRKNQNTGEGGVARHAALPHGPT